MAGGRPREYDLIQIGEALIEWAKRSDSINLNKFCCTHDPLIPPSNMLRWVKEDAQFRVTYETAKAFLGARREEMLSSGDLHTKAYDLNATVYDAFHRDEKITLDDMESARKVKEAKAGTPEERAKADEIVKQLDKLQKTSIENKND